MPACTRSLSVFRLGAQDVLHHPDGERGLFLIESGAEMVLIKAQLHLDTVVVQYGPLIHCAEGIDNDRGMHSLYIDAREPQWKMELCDTCVCPHFTVSGFRRLNADTALYYPLESRFARTDISLIPYHTFANRQESNMLVFLRYRD